MCVVFLSKNFQNCISHQLTFAWVRFHCPMQFSHLPPIPATLKTNSAILGLFARCLYIRFGFGIWIFFLSLSLPIVDNRVGPSLGFPPRRFCKRVAPSEILRLIAKQVLKASFKRSFLSQTYLPLLDTGLRNLWLKHPINTIFSKDQQEPTYEHNIPQAATVLPSSPRDGISWRMASPSETTGMLSYVGNLLALCWARDTSLHLLSWCRFLCFHQCCTLNLLSWKERLDSLLTGTNIYIYQIKTKNIKIH